MKVSNEYHKKWREDNREQWLKTAREAQARYRAAHSDKVKRAKAEKFKLDKNDPEFRRKNRERYQRWYAANKETAGRKHALQQIRRVYNVSVSKAEMLYEARKKGCEVCGSLEHPAIDHCHTTGVIRGILCRRCNQAIGQAKDDVNLILGWVKYLKGDKS